MSQCHAQATLGQIKIPTTPKGIIIRIETKMKVALNLLIRPTYFLFTLSVVFVLSLCPNTTSAESLATVNGIPISTQEYYSHYQRLLETHPNAQGKPKLESTLKLAGRERKS